MVSLVINVNFVNQLNFNNDLNQIVILTSLFYDLYPYFPCPGSVELA
jgi:hypothetical protein